MVRSPKSATPTHGTDLSCSSFDGSVPQKIFRTAHNKCMQTSLGNTLVAREPTKEARTHPKVNTNHLLRVALRCAIVLSALLLPSYPGQVALSSSEHTTQTEFHADQPYFIADTSYHSADHPTEQCPAANLTGQNKTKDQQRTLKNVPALAQALLTVRIQPPAHRVTHTHQPFTDPRLPAPKTTDWIGALNDCYATQRQLRTLGTPTRTTPRK